MADDTRVVQMQFDNKDFEKNISTSQKSLDRFKGSLNFDETSRGLTKFGKSIKELTFDSLISNVQKLTDKFTGLGNASEFVLSKIRAKLEELGTKAMSFVDSMTTVQMSAGFTKYESLNKAVQTLRSATGKEEKEVYAILERLNKYTDETSYDFAEGVTSISKLVSSGAATMGQAEKVVEGFYNLAAKAGADTVAASHALQYSINQAMGTGFMGLNDWKTLENLSIGTIDFKEQLLEAGVAVGKVTKEGNKYYIQAKKGTKTKKKEVNATNLFRDSLSEQWVTTDVLNKALEKYADTTTEFGAQAYAAAQRCTTFTDALNAWKDMLSTGWMQSYRIVFGDLGDAMALFSGVCNKVAAALQGLVDTRNKILESWKGTGGRDSLWGMLFGEIEDPDGKKLFEGAYGILDIFTQIGDIISEGFWNMVMNLIPKTEQKMLLDMVNKNLRELGLEKPFESFKQLWSSDFFKENGGREGIFGGMLGYATQQIQEFVASIRDWFNEIDQTSGLTRMQILQNVLNAVINTISFGFDIIGGIVHFFSLIGDQLSPSFEIIGNLFNALGIGLEQTEQEARNSRSITKFFEDLAEVVRPFSEMVNDIVAAIADLVLTLTQTKSVGEGISGVFKSIGDTIKKVFGKIADILRPVVTFISEVIGVISMLVKNGFDDRSMESAQKKIVRAFNRMWKGLKAAIGPILQALGEVFKTVWKELQAKVSSYFTNPETLGYKIIAPLKAVFGPVWNFLADGFNRLKEFFTKIIEAFKGRTLFDVLKVIVSENMLGGFVGRIKDWLSGTNLYSLIIAFLGGVALFKLVGLIKSWKEVGDNLNELAEKIKHPIKALMGNVGEEVENFGAKFLDFAKGVALVAASVVVLGSMGWQNALTGFAALIGVIGIVWGAVKLFEKTTKSIGLTEILKMVASFVPVVGAFIGFATSMLLMAAALKALGSMSWEQIGKGLTGLAGILLELIGFMLLTTHLPIGTAQLGGFIGFAASLAILVFSLKSLINISWDQFSKMMAGLGALLMELIGFMLLTSLLPIGTAQLGPFIGFAFSMGILIMALNQLKDMSWDQFGKMMAGLGGVLLQLIAMMMLTTVLPTTKLSSFIGFAVSLWLLISAIRPFANMSWEQYARAMAGLGGVLLEIIGFMTLFKVLGLSTKALNFTGILGFVISLWLIVQTIQPFAGMDWEQYGRTMAGLAGVLLEIIGFMTLFKVIGLSTKALNFTGMLGFVISLWVLVQAILPFAGMSWEQYGRSMAGLGGVLLQLIGFMAILNVVPVNPAKITAAVALAVGLGLIALALSFAINEVRNVKWETIAAFSAGLATTIIAMAAAIAILSVIPFGAGLKGIVLLGVAITALIGVLALLAPTLIGSIGSSLAELSGKLEMISGMLSGFSNRMGSIDEGNIDKAEGIFDKLKRLLGKLSGWGKFTGDLNDFGYSMFVLGTGVEIFNDHVGNAVTDLDTNAQAALKFIQDLSGCADDLDTISKMNMSNLISAVAGLGGAMSIYAFGAKEVQGLLAPGEAPDEGTVQSAIRILQAISTGLAESGGFTIPENMPDDQSLSLFGASLAALATALVRFEQAGQGLGTGTEKALGCLDFFQKLKNKLVETEFVKNIGAAIGIFDKENVKKEELTQFGYNIEALGKAMASFNNSVTTLNAATGERVPLDFSNAISTMDSLVELQGKLGWDFGPVVQFFAGRKKNFLDLGGEIEGLGTALKDFTDKLGGVDETGKPKLDTALFDEAISIADKVAEYLNKLSERMGRVGGIWNTTVTLWVGRDYNFNDLKEQIEALSAGLASIGGLVLENKVPTINETQGIFKVVDEITTYLQSLSEKMGTVGGIENIWDGVIFGRDYNFTDLKEQLVALGAGLSGLTSFKVEDLPTKEGLESAFPTIDALLDYMNSLKAKVSEGEGSVGGLYNIVNTALNGRQFNFEDLEKQLVAIGNGLSAIAGVNVDTDGTTIFNADGRGAAIDTVDALITYMQELGGKLGRVGGMKEFFTHLFEGKEADFDYVGTQLGYLGQGLGAFNSGLTANGVYDSETVSSALASLDSLIGIIQKVRTFSDEFYTIKDGMNSFSTPIRMENMSDWVIQMAKMLNYMNTVGAAEGVPNIATSLAGFILDFDAAMADLGGLQNAGSAGILEQVAQSLSNLVTVARNMTNDDGTMIDFQIVGQNISTGIAAGIASATGVVEAAARAVVKAAVDAANAEADSHSPSRVFMTVGGYMGQGMALGFSGEQSNVETAAEGVTNSAIETAQTAMATFAALMSQDIDANPTITPVLDLSNVTAGSALINGILAGERNLSLSGAGSDYSAKTVPRSERPVSEVRGNDYSGIYANIQSLGARIDAMGDKISNLQIVLDSGAVAGAVTDGVNRNLGRKTIFNRRRN